MSLVVSLRVPDGIVVAGDSLSTSQNLLEFVAQNVEVECPRCKETVTGGELRLPPVPIPFSASSYTQKVFSLYEEIALAYHGQGVVNNRSVYYHVKEFERSNDAGSLVAVRDRLITHLEKQLIAQFPKHQEDAPPDWRPVSFHLNGYEETDGQRLGVTYVVSIGRENKIERWDQVGCTIGGDLRVVQKLWEIGENDPRRKFNYGLFSLQDAIDLSEFLIKTTSTFQRFANELPTVGGEVDIALLTPFHGFQWIRRKELMETLEESRGKQPIQWYSEEST